MVYEGYDNMKAVRVSAKSHYNNKYGTFPHQASLHLVDALWTWP